MSRGPKPSIPPVARTSATVAVVTSAEAVHRLRRFRYDQDGDHQRHRDDSDDLVRRPPVAQGDGRFAEVGHRSLPVRVPDVLRRSAQHGSQLRRTEQGPHRRRALHVYVLRRGVRRAGRRPLRALEPRQGRAAGEDLRTLRWPARVRRDPRELLRLCRKVRRVERLARSRPAALLTGPLRRELRGSGEAASDHQARARLGDVLPDHRHDRIDVPCPPVPRRSGGRDRDRSGGGRALRPCGPEGMEAAVEESGRPGPGADARRRERAVSGRGR